MSDPVMSTMADKYVREGLRLTEAVECLDDKGKMQRKLPDIPPEASAIMVKAEGALRNIGSASNFTTDQIAILLAAAALFADVNARLVALEPKDAKPERQEPAEKEKVRSDG